jgi:hypothetical protein
LSSTKNPAMEFSGTTTYRARRFLGDDSSNRSSRPRDFSTGSAIPPWQRRCCSRKRRSPIRH